MSQSAGTPCPVTPRLGGPHHGSMDSEAARLQTWLPANGARNVLPWAATIGALAPVAVDIAVPLRARLTTAPHPAWPLPNVGVAALVLACAISGLLVLHRFPGHPVGWVLIAVAASRGWSGLLTDYAGHAGIGRLDEQTPGRVALWLAGWLWVPGYCLLATVLPAICPDGRPSDRRGQWVYRAGLTATVLATTLWALAPYDGRDAPPVDGLPDTVTNPIGVPLAGQLLPVSLIAVAAAALATLVLLALRCRQTVGLRRAQLGCVLAAATLTVALLAAAFALPAPLSDALIVLAAATMPVALGAAVLRYRLWDVELILARSLLFAGMSVIVIALYIGVVYLSGHLLGRGTGAPLLATALVAVAFQPLRTRLQSAVNQLIYGDRQNPASAVARLSDTLTAATTPQQMLDVVTATLARSLRVPSVAIITDERTLAVHGRQRHPEPFALDFAGSQVATLLIEPRRGEALSPPDLRLIAILRPHLARATRALLAELQRQDSHERLIRAREDERRRLRSDLHDDLGPQLAGIGMRLERIRLVLRHDQPAADAALHELTDVVHDTVRTVRNLGNDLRPPLLDELGLPRAVAELARRSSSPALTVTVDVTGLAELPAAVELAAYRIVAEALTNVLNHAEANSAQVHLYLDERTQAVQVAVLDDGIGIPASPRPGRGLASMAQRAADVGGVFTTTSTTSGTRLSATLPVRTP